MDARQAGQEYAQPFSPEERTTSGVPRSLAPSFQEYDIERLDPALHQDLIVERVLAFGDRRELRWLFGRYGRETISAWLARDGVRRLPWRRYNMWCVLLDVPHLPRQRTQEERIWPY